MHGNLLNMRIRPLCLGSRCFVWIQKTNACILPSLRPRHPSRGHVQGLAKRSGSSASAIAGMRILRGSNLSPAAEPGKALRRWIEM
jgi:hypothetical protein